MPKELIPKVIDVRAGPDYMLHVSFADGAAGSFDVGPYLWGPAFDHVRTDPAAFAAGRLDPDVGTVAWPGGADLAPEFLYDHAVLGQVAHADHDPHDRPVDCARTAIWELATGVADARVRQQTVEHAQAAVAALARHAAQAAVGQRREPPP